jgi:hypothetical protein
MNGHHGTKNKKTLVHEKPYFPLFLSIYTNHVLHFFLKVVWKYSKYCFLKYFLLENILK